ncbi:Eco57I restriction-modification methylase domain-containing protein [Halanaerobaculum tunisiense]
MAVLFNKKVLSKHLNGHEIDNHEQKLKIITDWQRNLENIKGVNEQRLQSAFLTGFFRDVLGYQTINQANKNNNYSLRIEPSTEVDSSHPDGSLGIFTGSEDGKTKAVIELKGPKISLDKKQNRSGKDYGTPVEQAFNYATKHDGCKWIIVSNMIEIRLYKYTRGQGHYEEFLINNLDQEKEFKKFHLLLSKDNLLNPEKGKSLTLELSEETVQHEEDISTEFYNLYKRVRIDLFEHLKENNPNHDEEILLEKAQKFLDRIIFICFCEDLALLPTDIIHKVIEQQKNSFTPSSTPVWDGIRGLFKSIDEGNPNHNINAYNGGLFKHDEVLDNLIIQDEFFDVINEISSYDFDSDLDVNILGHIFEQSISDIEELKANIQDNDYNKQESKRKKDGIFYTPEYITKYIVENSIGKYLNDIKENLGYNELPDIESASTPQVEGKYKKQHLEFYEEYEKRLKEIKILDPACGSGAFLNQAFDYLLQEHQWIHKQIEFIKDEHGQRSIFGLSSLQKSILKNNIFGVDLNEESVEITKLSLWLKTANKNKPLANLDDNIKCGNSLIDEPEIAGDKTFNWKEKFPEIMANGGFDIVIGNPPYVRQEKIKFIKSYLENSYQIFRGQADLYCYFFEKGLNLLNQNGYLAFISSKKFTRATYADKLRNYILQYQIYSYTDYDKKVVFKEATTDPCTIIIKKSQFNNNHTINYNNKYFIPQKNLSEDGWSFITKRKFKLKNKIEEKGMKLKKWNVKINYGIKTGYNKAFIINEKIKNRLIEKDPKSEEIIEPLLRGRNIDKYEIKSDYQYLLFTGYDLDITKKYPAIYKYLKQFEEKLKNRYDQGKNWWNLRECNYYNLFKENKIVWMELSDKPKFALDTNNFYSLNGSFIMTGNNLEFLISILNSKLSEWYFEKISNSSGVGTTQWRKFPIINLPIPQVNSKKQIPFINKVQTITNGKKTLTKKQKLDFIDLIDKYTSQTGPTLSTIVEQDGFFNKIYSGRARKIRDMTVNINDNIITIYSDKSSSGQYELMKFEVKNKYKRQYIKYYLENLTEEQLEEFNEFSGGLVKRILQIQLPDYDKYQVVRKVVNEWNQLQKEIEDLENKIEKTDQEIDQMVYDLYNLTDEEIKIVEESLD